VRRRLRNTKDPKVTLTEVAHGYGFNHPGYFAQDYRNLFGESPSETLSNARRKGPETTVFRQ
jgi:AraC family ethanolamine operon transcriptional activator